MPAENMPADAQVAPTPETIAEPDAHPFFDEAAESGRSEYTTQPPAPEPAKKPKISHPRWVERAAIEQGFTDQDIEETPTEALQQRIYANSQRQAHEARQAAISSDVAGAARRQAAPEPVVNPEPEEDELLSEDDWDPKFVKKWNDRVRRDKERDQEIAELKAAAGQFRSSQAATTQQRFEAMFAKYPNLYGQGASHLLPANSPDLLRRQAVMSQIQLIVQGGRATTPETDFDLVHGGLFGALAASPPPPAAPPVDPTRKEFADAYANGGLARPTQRNSLPLPKGRAAAISALNNLRKEHANGDGVYHDDDPSDGLPD